MWGRVLTWENLSVLLPQQDPASLAKWREIEASRVPKQDCRRFNGIVIYITWNLWKERNRRIFENVFQTVQQVAYSTKEDIVQRHRAMNFGVEAN